MVRYREEWLLTALYLDSLVFAIKVIANENKVYISIIKGNGSDVADIAFEILAKKESQFFSA